MDCPSSRTDPAGEIPIPLRDDQFYGTGYEPDMHSRPNIRLNIHLDPIDWLAAHGGPGPWSPQEAQAIIDKGTEIVDHFKAPNAGSPGSTGQGPSSGEGLPTDVGPQTGWASLFAPFGNALLAIAHSTDFLPPCWQVVAGVALAVGFSAAIVLSGGTIAAIGAWGLAGVYTVATLWVVEGLTRSQSSSSCWGF